MNALLLVFVLALGWMAMTGGFSLPNLLLGAAVAGFVIFLFRHTLRRPLAIERLFAALLLALFFVGELLLSALAVARLAATPDLAARLRPAIIAFPLTVQSDAEITLLANLITLTPGTLTLDVAPDRRHLYIHVLVLADRESLVAGIAAGFEQKVINVFR
jgi:multicomponent Na+:H+ antiporter subunit E